MQMEKKDAKNELSNGDERLESDGGSWESLCEHLGGNVLSHLSFVDVVRASLVCKTWRSTIASPSFIHLHSRRCIRRPWFFLYGINFLVSARSQAFAYDFDSRKWRSLPLTPFPEHDKTSLAVSSGFLFAITGSNHLQLCYKHHRHHFAESWKITPPMNYSRMNPIVNFAEDSISGHCTIIVCGGVPVYEDDDLVVEIFESQTGSWKMCARLPREFKESSSAHWTTSVIHKGSYFVHEMYSGSTSALDLHLKSWGNVHVLRPWGVRSSHLLSCDGDLILAGICSTENRGAFKVWNVDEATMECREIGRMPEDLYVRVFEGEEEDDKSVNLKCAAAGELLYVFSLEQHKGYPVVACQILNKQCCWMQLPTLPQSINRFDNVVATCAPVTLKSFF